MAVSMQLVKSNSSLHKCFYVKTDNFYYTGRFNKNQQQKKIIFCRKLVHYIMFTLLISCLNIKYALVMYGISQQALPCTPPPTKRSKVG